MEWYTEITNHYKIDFTLADPEGNHQPPDPAIVALVRKCPFKSAVYIVLRINEHQYVGESGNVGERFVAGMGKTEHGYVWPQTGGNFTVHFFEVPANDNFRKAIEIEVMLLLRLYTGYWPVETSKADPFHQLRLLDMKISIASTRAREIVNKLFVLEPAFKKSFPEQEALLVAFDAAEARLHRR